MSLFWREKEEREREMGEKVNQHKNFFARKTRVQVTLTFCANPEQQEPLHPLGFSADADLGN